MRHHQGDLDPRQSRQSNTTTTTTKNDAALQSQPQTRSRDVIPAKVEDLTVPAVLTKASRINNVGAATQTDTTTVVKSKVSETMSPAVTVGNTEYSVGSPIAIRDSVPKEKTNGTLVIPKQQQQQQHSQGQNLAPDNPQQTRQRMLDVSHRRHTDAMDSLRMQSPLTPFAVRVMKDGEQEIVIDLLDSAFKRNPLAIAINESNPSRWRQFIGTMVNTCAPPPPPPTLTTKEDTNAHGFVHVISRTDELGTPSEGSNAAANIAAAAVWEPVRGRDEVAHEDETQGFPERVTRFFVAIDEAAPEPPYMYLNLLGSSVRGAGSTLVNAGVKEAAARGFETVALETEDEGTIGFYQRLGFKLHRRVDYEDMSCWWMVRSSSQTALPSPSPKQPELMPVAPITEKNSNATLRPSASRLSTFVAHTRGNA